MARVRVGSLAQLPPGSVSEFKIGEDSIALCNADGEIHAVDGLCPHRQGPLGHGALHGHMLACPWHAWEFDCRTGEHDYNPQLRLKKFAVSVQDGAIFVEIP
jgi:nitrite reductase (NADH) small subunit